MVMRKSLYRVLNVVLFALQASQRQIEEAMKGMMDSKNRLAFEKGGLQVSVTIVYLVESAFHAFTGKRLLLRQYMLTSLVRCTVM